MNKSMAGWIAFAGMVLMIIGGIDAFQGLMAVIRDHYYAPDSFAFDVSTWGWLMMIWGAVLFFTGYGLLSGASWARWLAIFGVSVSLLGQLGFQGNTFMLWGFCLILLDITVLYALIARWDESKRELTGQ